jgi:hypothetical protein
MILPYFARFFIETPFPHEQGTAQAVCGCILIGGTLIRGTLNIEAYPERTSH